MHQGVAWKMKLNTAPKILSHKKKCFANTKTFGLTTTTKKINKNEMKKKGTICGKEKKNWMGKMV